jgi:hypothetical protein
MRYGTALATLALTAGVTLAAMPATQASDAQRVRQYPRCATEDSAHCIWRNQGPGFSFVSGAPRHPAPRVYRVSGRLADKLIRRDNWQRAPRGMHVDTVRGNRTFVTGRHAVISYGPTTYVIRANGTVGGS